jgi:hypothetical protein
MRFDDMDGQHDPLEFFTPEKVECRLKESIEELLAKDAVLLQHDVSERAITHKLAEYLQVHFPSLNVDCEYNRNAERGAYAAKVLGILRESAREVTREVLEQTQKGDEMVEEEILSVSTYPDIIVHRRTVNSHNLLVVEVKKALDFPPAHNYERSYQHDYAKLCAFTESEGHNPYRYRYGYFLLLGVRSSAGEFDLQLFQGGRLVHKMGEQHDY